jgi:hypothetical protein
VFLSGRKKGKPMTSDELGDVLRREATTDLVSDLTYLLVEGYENNWGKGRVGSPSNPLSYGNRYHAVEWFGAVLMIGMRDFVRERIVWRGHESDAIKACNEVIGKWCLKHGATEDVLNQLHLELTERWPSEFLHRTESIDKWLDKWHAFEKRRPELFSGKVSAFCKLAMVPGWRGVVDGFFLYEKRSYNKYESDPILGKYLRS